MNLNDVDTFFIFCTLFTIYKSLNSADKGKIGIRAPIRENKEGKTIATASSLEVVILSTNDPYQ